MKQFLIDTLVDHHKQIYYIEHRKMYYSLNKIKKYGIDNVIVLRTKNNYLYDAVLYLIYHSYLTVLK